ncbi:LytTR family DNA-binding domain-containing protein [Lysinibacillus sp. FSL H8-0500]|uniref:LytR/AlgR family response regulator transcription factor n=1 Tax=Lysinibacillus sp. FSL H8-0500 TaxID=2921393 RepID=UPI0031015909
MRVAICEDDPFHQQLIVEAIQNYALFQAPSIDIVLCTQQPADLLSQIDTTAIDCYILDIELGGAVNGLDIAKTIREQDPLAHIIFMTSYANYLQLTFTYKVAALDFIVKDTPAQMQHNVVEALQAALTKYTQLGTTASTKWFQVKMGEKVKNIALEDIYYFETSSQPHKLELYERNGHYSFYGALKDLAYLDDHFFRCHKSFIIHLKNVKEFNFKSRYVLMENGSRCPIAFRLIVPLQKRLKSLSS